MDWTNKSNMIVVLDNIRSVYNVGSIFRTADGAGVKKVYLCGITPAPTDRFGRRRKDFVKVSLGAEDYVEWEVCESTIEVLKKLKKEGNKIFAVEQSKKSIPYFDLQLITYNLQHSVLVLGNEVGGLSDDVLRIADKILEIPMRGKKESLNVAVAFGIVVFHLTMCG